MPAAKKAYVNTTSNNIFTEGGRCGPGDTIELTADEAKNYAGLEQADKVKTKTEEPAEE